MSGSLLVLCYVLKLLQLLRLRFLRATCLRGSTRTSLSLSFVSFLPSTRLRAQSRLASTPPMSFSINEYSLSPIESLLPASLVKQLSSKLNLATPTQHRLNSDKVQYITRCFSGQPVGTDAPSRTFLPPPSFR